MRYVLITPSGRQYFFHLRACAELFRTIRGGIIEERQVDVSV